MYTCFVRDWWKDNASWPNGLEPYGGAPKHRLCEVDTEEEAREFCQDYNATHSPGRYSRKAEFTEGDI